VSTSKLGLDIRTTTLVEINGERGETEVNMHTDITLGPRK
jgi:hypothetical protein